jgi:hypothetical protein
MMDIRAGALSIRQINDGIVLPHEDEHGHDSHGKYDRG